jgi:predicted DCC family thiol-disulfide oxidoreductase YuxK
MSRPAASAPVGVAERTRPAGGAILLFDGVCNVCNRAVQFVIAHDSDAYFRFAALQSPAGQRILAQHGVARDVTETIVLVEDGGWYVRSDAVVRLVRHLSGGWRLLRFLAIVPRPLRDWAYRRFAASRYRWFGRRATCMIPSPELRARFLEE